MAVKDHYNDYKPRDYNNEYSMLEPDPELMKSVIDNDRFGLNTPDPVSRYYPPLTGVREAVFRYQAHKTSNNNARDTLYYGHVQGDIDLVLWGFETYQEFRDHLTVTDKHRAQEAWEELKCQIAGTHAECRFWLPKNDLAATRPGFWAITVDQANTRFALCWANDEYHLLTNLRRTKQNKIKL